MILDEQFTSGRPLLPSDSVDNLVNDGICLILENTGTAGAVTIRQRRPSSTDSGPRAPQSKFTVAGVGFTNQPANDGVEMVSAEAGDTTQSITVYYTRDGQGDTVYSEEVALNGVTQVALADTDVSKVLGVELDAACTGIVTVREASANATITTIPVGTLQVGVTDVNGAHDPIIPSAKASAAETGQLGLVGTTSAGVAQDDSQALTGTTEVAFNSTFGKLTKILHGDIASGVTVVVYSGYAFSTWLAPGERRLVPRSALGVQKTDLGSGVTLTGYF